MGILRAYIRGVVDMSCKALYVTERRHWRADWTSIYYFNHHIILCFVSSFSFYHTIHLYISQSLNL